MLVFILSTIYFFSPVFIDHNLIVIISVLIMTSFFFITFREIFLKKSYNKSYRVNFRLLIGIFLLAAINPLILHDQPIILGYRSIMEVMPYSIFFVLLYFKYEYEDVEKLVQYISVVYLFAFYTAIAVAPLIIFDKSGGGLAELNSSRGVARIQLAGTAFIYLQLFISINKWSLEKRKKHLIWIIICLVTIVLNVSRQHILASFALGFLLLFRNFNVIYKILSVLLFYFLIQYFLDESEIGRNLFTLTQKQLNETGLENVRILAFEYYMLDYKSNLYSILFGDGMLNLSSKWGEEFLSNMYLTGFVPSDVGYAKLYLYFGLVGLLAFIYLFLKAFTEKFDSKYRFIKYYLTFILFTNIGSHSFFTDGITIGIVFYIIELTRLNNSKILKVHT